MVKYNPRTWFSLIFHSYSRKMIKLLMPAIIFMGAYTTLLCYIILDYFELNFRSTTEVHSILGIVLGLFLVFRMNSAYDRWWEGRVYWGNLINSCRNLAIKFNSFLPEDEKDSRIFFAKMIPNFAYALKEHLRKGVIFKELEVSDEILGKLKSAKNVPGKLMAIVYGKVNTLYRNDQLTGEQLFVLDKELKSLTDIMGSCERIKNTPIPYSYSMYLKKFIFTFIITLPFGFVTAFYYWTIPIVLLLFFILVSIELIAEEIEDPFGTDMNDLPTDQICMKIKSNVEEILEEGIEEPQVPVSN